MPKGLRARISIKKDCLPMKDSNKEITLRLTDSPGDVARAAELLRAGRLVAIPTETVYGLAAGWEGIRTATVSSPALTSSGIRPDRGRIIVSGPGQ